ncbi:HIRAN domain-containing protein [Pustulibacterium marinum]|uniref:HIRAN domain-containing protein n=1 Tax=Pustulibacterium marinum TaxID=1224947 RepID=A0A1I7GY87_9FLAO|nr:HIRAN domain-containing protein [Pustulibacterium marinum]SFU53397.1 HIRAN domain-containing protein [Pustulibacterium marinum]
MKSIGNIFLIWRKGKGSRRIPIGIIKRNINEGVRFEYLQEGLDKAKKLGFGYYEGFPDTNKVYTENILEIFGQRIMRSERNDIKNFYDFWQIDPKYKEDDFYMLAYTQGLLPTDNFEFLADFNPKKNLSFITEIAGLTKLQIPADTLKVGDSLSYQLENNNEYDKDAVKVSKNGVRLGYIKCIHNKIFHKANKKKKINVTVHRIEKNGVLNRVFLKVSL